MEIKRARHRRAFRPGLVAGLFVLSAAAVRAEPLPVRIEIADELVAVREQIRVSLYIGTADARGVQVEQVVAPAGLTLVSGPAVRPFADDADPDMPMKVRASYAFRADAAGRHILPAVTVRSGEREGRSPEVVVSVGIAQRGHVVVPPVAEWRVERRSLFAGEATPVYLILRHATEIVLADSYRIVQPRGALFDEAPGLGEIELIEVGDRVLYNLPVASFILTPSQSGRLALPTASVLVRGARAEPAAVSLDVQPLPRMESDSGAIGVFRFTSSVNKRTARAGEEVRLTVRVEGTGNLNFLQLPEPDMGSAVLLEKVETADFVPSTDGFSGRREALYRFVPQATGRQTVLVPAFTWVDSSERRVVSSAGRSHDVAVTAEEPAETPFENVVPFRPQSAEQIARHVPRAVYRDPLNYLWMIPVPLVFVLLLVLKRARVILVALVCLLPAASRREVPVDPRLSAAVRAYDAGDFTGAGELLLASVRADGMRAGVMYNLALTEYQLQSPGLALHSLRTAIRLRPAERVYRDCYAWMNDSLDLGRAVSPAPPVHPDVFFYGVVGMWSLGFAAMIVQLARNRGFYIIVFILGMVCAAGSVTGLGVTASLLGRTNGVVGSETTEVRRIPSAAAADWITFPRGQSLRVLDTSAGFHLVETGFGLKGWVLAEDVLIDGEPPAR